LSACRKPNDDRHAALDEQLVACRPDAVPLTIPHRRPFIALRIELRSPASAILVVPAIGEQHLGGTTVRTREGGRMAACLVRSVRLLGGSWAELAKGLA
jgi:hypothetical protein